ncbi:MAG: sulfatase/phosphatase domain-containing protein, partial [Allomuricauda sp.]
EIAGLKEEAKKSVDGMSIVPLLSGKGAYPTERPIYWHFPNTYDQPPYSAVRKGAWKLIYHHIDRKMELFNLEKDIGETENLTVAHAAKKEELVQLLSNYLAEVEAQMPWDKSTEKLVEYPIEITENR